MVEDVFLLILLCIDRLTVEMDLLNLPPFSTDGNTTFTLFKQKAGIKIIESILNQFLSKFLQDFEQEMAEDSRL